jgi:hypothetical protein
MGYNTTYNFDDVLYWIDGLECRLRKGYVCMIAVEKNANTEQTEETYELRDLEDHQDKVVPLEKLYFHEELAQKAFEEYRKDNQSRLVKSLKGDLDYHKKRVKELTNQLKEAEKKEKNERL